MRKLMSILALAALAAGAGAQNQFWADLDGSQETPPVATFAGGWGQATLNPGNTLSYEVRVYGMSATVAHIHIGAPGVPGGVVFPLAGGPSVFSGTTVALSAAQLATLRSNGYYFNVHSAAFPGGQVRGQIEVRPIAFATRADGAQEVPMVTLPGTGTGTVDFAPGGALDYDLTASGLSGIASDSHFHAGPVGVNGPIVAGLGPVGPWLGTTPALTPAQLSMVQDGDIYWNVHTGAFPGGEIRGQVVASGHRYGDLAQYPIALDSSGPPVDGGSITIDIVGGAPGTAGFLLVALGPDAAVLNGEAFLLEFSSIVIDNLILPLNGAGELHVSQTIPPLLGIDIDIFLQFFNLDASAPNGIYNVSNGLRLPLRAL